MPVINYSLAPKSFSFDLHNSNLLSLKTVLGQVSILVQVSMIVANVPSQCKMLVIGETTGEEIDALSAQYFCKYKTALINEVYF